MKLNINGTEFEVEIKKQGETLRLKRDGRELEAAVVEAARNEIVLERNGRRIRVVGTADGDKRQIWVDGRIIRYVRVQERGAGAGGGAGSLSANIPAVVSQVLVQAGDAVKAGQKLILLESMKMIIPIQAPMDGVVTAVKCTVGDSVQPGVALVEVE